MKKNKRLCLHPKPKLKLELTWGIIGRKTSSTEITEKALSKIYAPIKELLKGAKLPAAGEATLKMRYQCDDCRQTVGKSLDLAISLEDKPLTDDGEIHGAALDAARIFNQAQAQHIAEFLSNFWKTSSSN